MMFLGTASVVLTCMHLFFQIRHSAIRTLFQSMSSHGHQLSTAMWEHCIGTLVFPMVDTVRTLVSMHIYQFMLKVLGDSETCQSHHMHEFLSSNALAVVKKYDFIDS